MEHDEDVSSYAISFLVEMVVNKYNEWIMELAFFLYASKPRYTLKYFLFALKVGAVVVGFDRYFNYYKIQ